MIDEDALLDQYLADDEDRDDPEWREIVRGSFGFQSALLGAAAGELGGEVEAQYHRFTERVAVMRDRALRRWWNDRR